MLLYTRHVRRSVSQPDLNPCDFFLWGHMKDTVYRKNPTTIADLQLIWPSGKGVGGSSILNGMIYVRGNRKNYDDWAAQGATGWSFKDVWPYFVKLEDNRDPDFLANGYHASGGPITVERPGYRSEIEDPILEAAQKLGYRVGDSNAARQTGFNELQGTFRNGQRCSTAKAYLVPAENRTNLDIVAGAHVRKVENPIPLKIRRVLGLLHAESYVRGQTSSRWCGAVRKLGEEVPAQASSDRLSKLRVPFQNSSRVASKLNVNIIKLISLLKRKKIDGRLSLRNGHWD
ncbi:Glucose dehydrogenase [FAD, quinone] [Araneus ventricosus]|uniref:Glucose dehydrogenase [FAD, quinone] n=1 Tax=Araneus ventricosus TaxID=182803 RepID=A0A4Y2VI75_ARAVE|nr:Glucose dehydrogenase [FAD, quinone] [Araneus ventricosus]